MEEGIPLLKAGWLCSDNSHCAEKPKAPNCRRRGAFVNIMLVKLSDL
jgi:hypothetical protein